MHGSIPDKVTISGGGDLSCYPDLLPLTKMLSQGMVPVALGYTSGKGFKSANDAADLVEAGVKEVSFTVFSTNPDLRSKYMNDKTPRLPSRTSRYSARAALFTAPSFSSPASMMAPSWRRPAATWRTWVRKD